MSRSSLRASLLSGCGFLALAAACGGRSDVPGSDFEEPSPFLSTTGGTAGKAGGTSKAGGAGVAQSGFGGAGPGTGGVGPGTGGVGPGTGGVGPGTGGVGPGTGGVGPGTGGVGPGAGGGLQTCGSCFVTLGQAQCPGDTKACLSNANCASFDSCVKKLNCLDQGFGVSFQKCISQCGSPASQQQWLKFANCTLCGSACAFNACAAASNEVCGVSEGPGGGPQGCQQGAMCSSGSGCAGPDPFNPGCQISCNCFGGVFDCTTTCSGPGAGGGPQDCNSCVPVAANQICPDLAKQCQQFPGCTNLFDCITKTGCHAAPNPIACASQSGCNLPAGPATNVAADLSSCGKCNGCGQCPISPGECGTNPIGGPGAGGGAQSCGDCSLGAIQTGQCPAELGKCEATPGCIQLAQCAKTTGCLEGADPVACAQQSCKGTPAAFASFGELFKCIGCGTCQPSCLACGGGVGGSAGSGGGTGQSCDECIQNSQFKCQSQINQCFSNPQCSQFLDCVQNEDPDVCQMKFPKGVPGYQAIIECLACQACGAECVNDVPPGFCPIGL